MQRLAFPDASALSRAIDELFAIYPVAMYYGIDTVAPFPDFQSHDGYELYYVWRGEGAYIADGDVHALEAGTLMPIRPRTLHKVLQTDADAPVCRHVLLIREDCFRRESLAPETAAGGNSGSGRAAKSGDSSSGRAAKSGISGQSADGSEPLRFGSPIVVPAEQRPDIEYLYRMIHEELSARQPGYELAVSGCVRTLLAKLRRLAGDETRLPASAPDRLPPEVVYLLQHVGSNFQQPLSLEELARKVHMNANYVSHLFHRYTGYTLRQFMTMKRMHHAKNLLRDTELPVQVIAAESGYQDSSHFIRTFRRTFGTTPQAYRNGNENGTL